ncbi:ABC transporter permease [Cupriavidus plantarum]|uniref:ABC transporter permease n=1 Tax=Cupriavidus plantarum TaxID=942865 RepID=UPI000F277495|nr:ABC transporter permease [Cupriavidus plantarum]RLK39386.1 peptide/nickel transport system permease protein [Cupriavidus plantarum]
MNDRSAPGALPATLSDAATTSRLPLASGLARTASRIVLQRGLQALIVATLVGTLSFVMMRLLPGDMAFRIAAGRYGYDMVTAQAAEAVRAELGLGLPWSQALIQWWHRLLQGDLGLSAVTGAPVIAEIGHQLGHTLTLAIAALAVSCAIAVPLGFVAGLHAGGTMDRATLVASVLLRAKPPFVLGIVLVSVLSIDFALIPAAGPHEHGGLIAPAITLGLGLAATSMRVARDAMAAVASSPYFRFAQTKGLTDRDALLRHGIRNAAIPLVAYLGVQLVFLVEGVVVIETLFAWPGIGHALVHAIFGRDVPMIQGTAIVMGLMFVALNTLVDLACAGIDPRLRLRPWSRGARHGGAQ